jgi:hypothetical protein
VFHCRHTTTLGKFSGAQRQACDIIVVCASAFEIYKFAKQKAMAICSGWFGVPLSVADWEVPNFRRQDCMEWLLDSM